jgi:hypothetical protein
MAAFSPHRLATRPQRALLASAHARMGSGIFLALGIVAVHARGLAPLAVLLAGLIVLAAAESYADGMSLFPETGGPAALARHAFDELASFATGWAASLALVATTALAALFAARYLGVIWDPLPSGWWSVAGGRWPEAWPCSRSSPGPPPPAAGPSTAARGIPPVAVSTDATIATPERAQAGPSRRSRRRRAEAAGAGAHAATRWSSLALSLGARSVSSTATSARARSTRSS